MKTPSSIVRLMTAALLITAGLVCWRSAAIARSLAIRHERLATLQVSEVDHRVPENGWLDRLTTAFAGDEIPPGATEPYWRGEYDALAGQAGAKDEDPETLQLMANAMFREVQRLAGAGPSTVERLDQVLEAYASVLENGEFLRDAAYNYEYVARLRDLASRAKPPARRSAPPPTPPVTMPAERGNLPSGPTIHGRPGVHPPSTRGEDFEVLTPMDFGDREAQPEATPGRRLPRKG